MKVIVGISGASLTYLGIEIANELFKANCDVCVIFSQNAKISLACESLEMAKNLAFARNSERINSKIAKIFKSIEQLKSQPSLKTAKNFQLLSLGDELISKILNPKISIQNEIYESSASGSSGYEAMIIAPCSINCLAKIYCGISDSLLTRAAAVMLKERRKLVLGVREMPLSPISLKQMSALSKLGVIIAPPILASYGGLDEMQNFIIGKWLDILGVKNDLYKRWQE